MLSQNHLASRALDVNAALLALGCEQFRADGATWVRDREFPEIYDANHLTALSVSSPDEIDHLLVRAEAEYSHCHHRRIHVDFRTSPLLSARLALEGYARDDSLLMLLEGVLAGGSREHDIRPVTMKEDWQAYASLKAADWEEHRQRLPDPKPGPEIGRAFVEIYRRKAPELQYYLAYVDGKPAAFFSSWPGIDGMGQVEDLFTLPEHRHKGLATALMHRGVRDCRERGAQSVIIACDPTNTPKNMYRAMGFRPVALQTHYLKRLTPHP